jgi:hypothetical protein
MIPEMRTPARGSASAGIGEPTSPQSWLAPRPAVRAGRAIWPLVGLILCGCVERRMTIRTDPPGALVVLDGQEIGHSPVSTAFTYYGERQLRLVKDGYETKTINQRIATPWYEYPPLDFASEVLVPWRIRDERNYLYSLEPAVAVRKEQLLERAEATRQDGRNPPPEALRRAGLAQP